MGGQSQPPTEDILRASAGADVFATGRDRRIRGYRQRDSLAKAEAGAG